MRSDNFALDYEVGRTPRSGWAQFARSSARSLASSSISRCRASCSAPAARAGKAFFFFTLLAFVAGFSERLAQVILGGAERTVAGTLEEADKAAGERSTTKTTEDGTTTITTRKTPPASS